MATQDGNTSAGTETRTLWTAVLERDLLWDGVLFYGVRSTGIYCRPSCPIRRPRRNQVAFFSVPDAAESAGFRPCLRCRPNDVEPPGPVRLVHLVCTLLEQEPAASTSLTDICQHLGVGMRTMQRAFQRTLGVTFQEYVGALRLQAFKASLQDGNIITDALYKAGYGSSSQLYTEKHSFLGMTPGEYKRGGRGLTIDYALSPYGEGWVAAATTTHGRCALFIDSSAAELQTMLHREFPNAALEEDRGPLLHRLQAAALALGDVRPVPGLPSTVQDVALRHRFLKALQSTHMPAPV
jgi:AraC family transcriptional regulator of adaptative response/methylated-DNA-[protein]-cysteine methyltransferase